MKGMTIKQIADIANVGESTIRRWIGYSAASSAKTAHLPAKMAQAAKKKKAALFTLEEVISIIKAGGNHTLANLLEENARQMYGLSYPGSRTEIAKKSLSGAFIRELRETLGAVEAGKRIDYLLGYSRREEPVSPEVAREHLTSIRLSLTEKPAQMTLSGL